MLDGTAIAGLAVLVPAWTVFSWWSWRAVRRRAAVYAPAMARFGFSVFGGMMWITSAISQSLTRIDAPPGAALGMPAFWRHLPVGLIIGFPLWLWGDYFFHRVLAAGLGTPRPPRPPRS
jgi:hypothetical protein